MLTKQLYNKIKKFIKVAFELYFLIYKTNTLFKLFYVY